MGNWCKPSYWSFLEIISFITAERVLGFREGLYYEIAGIYHQIMGTLPKFTCPVSPWWIRSVFFITQCFLHAAHFIWSLMPGQRWPTPFQEDTWHHQSFRVVTTARAQTVHPWIVIITENDNTFDEGSTGPTHESGRDWLGLLHRQIFHKKKDLARPLCRRLKNSQDR